MLGAHKAAVLPVGGAAAVGHATHIGQPRRPTDRGHAARCKDTGPRPY
jgi:hypothetical protein